VKFHEAVAVELSKARILHANINSAHEGYAVILEELDEFFEEVRKKRDDRDLLHMMKELIQISAMAQRTAEDVLEPMLIGTSRP